MSEAGVGIKDKLIMLLMTALVTGIAVPVMTTFVQTRWSAQQKTAEASLMRQSSLIKDQEELLKRVQEKLFAFRILIVKVAWYSYVEKNPEKYKLAMAEFDAAGWRFHTDIYQELTNVRRLASSGAYEKFKLLYDAMAKLDNRLVILGQKPNATEAEWKSLHEDANQTASSVQDFIVNLAEDFQLRSVSDL